LAGEGSSGRGRAGRPMVLTRLFLTGGTGVLLASMRNWSQIGGARLDPPLHNGALGSQSLPVAAGDRAFEVPVTHPTHHHLPVAVRQAGIITGAQPPGGTPSRHRSFPARLGVVAASSLPQNEQENVDNCYSRTARRASTSLCWWQIPSSILTPAQMSASSSPSGDSTKHFAQISISR
jgi:hypothetical protein